MLIGDEFRNLFQNSIKINARTISVKTLLSERNIRRINYSPYYQRNYIWDKVKQSFFIESVVLGTEIPPLILFKSGNQIEVIDGRQRFETLKRFKENDFSLNIRGLKELQFLKKISFNKVPDEIKEIFLSSNIRIFEFEIINHPNIKEDMQDRIKKEIFRRYNTGITSLTREELDNAKYDDDEFSELFKKILKDDDNFYHYYNECFFNKKKLLVKNSLIVYDVDFARRYRVLNSFPISKYAAGGNRIEIFELLYDFVNNSVEDVAEEFSEFISVVNSVIDIYKDMSTDAKLKNNLIYECILWAITIIKKESIEFNYDSKLFNAHYIQSIGKYSDDSSYYYTNIIERYTDTAKFFEDITGFKFHKYIKNDVFKKRIDGLRQTEQAATESIYELSSLRLHKTNPISTPIDEIRADLKSSRYCIRPSYQRQEKINIQKASSIIESILLGIYLPPIFLFKRKDSVKEVVDGQQRLLSIIGFLGEQYYDEDGKMSYSKNNNFKLKGLKILTELEGKSFSGLSNIMQDKILDFTLDFIVIEESINKNFDPTDLFIRLNYKPYPIKSNSFEMWNSVVNHEVIKMIKDDVVKKQSDWFFLRENNDDRPNRMENEEMITILSYICYMDNSVGDDGVIGFFLRNDRITCRLKNKMALGEFLISLDKKAIEKSNFLNSITKTNDLINIFHSLFLDDPSKEGLNEFLNVKMSHTFRRSLQDFYVIWLLLNKMPHCYIIENKEKVLSDIRKILSLLKNVTNGIVDEKYIDRFKLEMQEVLKCYKTE